MTVRDLSRKQILALADAHIKHFERAKGPGWRPDEVTHYPAIWRNVRIAAVDELIGLTPEEEGEIQDAIDCGDYDDLIEANREVPA